MDKNNNIDDSLSSEDLPSEVLATEDDFSSQYNVDDIVNDILGDFIEKEPVSESKLKDDAEATKRKIKAPCEPVKITCYNCGQKLDVSDLEPFTKHPCPSCEANLIIPMAFESFLLEELIFEGDYSCTFRALDLALDREVALKILNLDIAKDEELSQLFLDNARAIAAVNHPNILPVYSCGDAAGQPYFVMQYMAAGAIKNQLSVASSLIPVHNVINCIKDVIEGLNIAQSKGIVHNNISTGNVLMCEDRTIKISDFNMGVLAPGYNLNSQASDDFARYNYISPEQAQGNSQNHLSDIFSLGVVFYQMLTVRKPFVGASVEQVLQNRLDNTPIPPDQLRNDIPNELSNFIMKMLAIYPASRPQSYAEILTFLNSLTLNVLVSKKKKTSPKSTVKSNAKTKTAKVPLKKKKLLKSNKSSNTIRIVKTQRKIKKNSFVSFLQTLFFLVLIFAALAFFLIKTGIMKTEKTGNIDTNNVENTQDLNTKKTLNKPAFKFNSAVNEDKIKVLKNKSNIKSHKLTIENNESATNLSKIDKKDLIKTDIIDSTKQVIKRSNQNPIDVSHRPKPLSLDFFSVKKELKKYVKEQHPKMYPIEKYRIKQLSLMRLILMKYMKYLPFESKSGVKIARGRRIIRNAIIPYCSPKEFTVKRVNRRKETRVKWSDIPFEQYVIFFDYYIKIKIDMGTNSKTNKKEIASDAFRLALLCDWYKDKKNALKYASQAKEYDSSIRAMVDSMVPTLELKD